MRFSKSTSRGLTKTGCVCESTNPGRTTLPAQSISVTLLRFLLSHASRRASLVVPTETILPFQAQHGAVFDDAEFFQIRSAPRTSFRRGGAQGEKLADVDQQQGVW